MSDNMEPPALCPSWALAVGYGGVAAAACLSNWGSAWGTWKSGVSLVHTGIRHPASVMKNVIPVVMAGVIGIYGLIVAVILAESIPKPGADTRINSYSIYTAFAHLCAGLCAGISGLAAGGCIGIVGDAGVRANAQQPRLFVGMILILIFAEALGLYGLIVGLVVASTAEGKGKGLCAPYNE